MESTDIFSKKTICLSIYLLILAKLIVEVYDISIDYTVRFNQ